MTRELFEFIIAGYGVIATGLVVALYNAYQKRITSMEEDISEIKRKSHKRDVLFAVMDEKINQLCHDRFNSKWDEMKKDIENNCGK